MKEAITMWRYRRMVWTTVAVAVAYTFLLVPFKGLAIIPGFASIRPGAALPVVAGLLFGPAGAWGAALGNAAGDLLGGTANPVSPYGFVGNFLFGMVGYKLWGQLGRLSTGSPPSLARGEQFPEYLGVSLVAGATVGGVIGWGGEVTGLIPFSAFTAVITVTDFFAAALLGAPLLYVLYPRVRDAGLLYWQVMSPRDRGVDGGLPDHPLAGRFTAGVVVAWTAVGATVGTIQGVPPGTSLAAVAGTAGSPVQIGVGAVAVVLLTAGLALCPPRAGTEE